MRTLLERQLIIEYTCCIDGIIYNIVALQYFIYQYYTPFHFEL